MQGILGRMFAPCAVSTMEKLAPRRYSVDQCLYVAMAYCGSYSQTRGDKTRDALTAMGISINAGSFGMLNVGIALFSCVMPVLGPRVFQCTLDSSQGDVRSLQACMRPWCTCSPFRGRVRARASCAADCQ